LLLVAVLAGCGEAYNTLTTPPLDSGTPPMEGNELDINDNGFPSLTSEGVVYEPEPPEEALEPRESDFSALELIGYHIKEDGAVIINGGWENECDIDVFRQYVFGTWQGWSWANRDGFLIIDDSEMCSWNLKTSLGGIYHYNDIIIFICYGNATIGLFWLDINEPDIMYCKEVDGSKQSGFSFWGNNVYKDEGFNTNFLTRTDAPINEPQNNYLSPFRLTEKAEELGVEYNMLTYINEFDEYHFYRDWRHYYHPVYLISESSDRLVLKSQIGYAFGMKPSVDITYTLEKADGEWVRTVEADMARLEEAINS